jgi:hypothetical protein
MEKAAVLTLGDAARVYVEPLTNFHFYAYLVDAQKTLHCLFPGRASEFGIALRPGTPLLLPEEPQWLVMDEQKGTESIYLLASAERLTGIEAATRRAMASPGDAELRALLLEEIRAVRRAKEGLTTVVEKGSPIVGTVVAVLRGDSNEATLTEARGFYGKTLRLNHE